MTGIALLGATGSIGRQTLDVVRTLGDRFRVLGLAAGHTSPELADLLGEFRDARAWTPEGQRGAIPTDRWTPGGLEELATLSGVEIVVVATTGIAALPAVLEALGAGRRVALANKEVLVTGGHLVADVMERLDGDPLDRLRPIDSEHSAIWQCLAGERLADVARLVLTASGGPFLDRAPGDAGRIRPEDALAHPTWRMGAKITVDSATLVNKAFEAIEARWLYRLPYSKIGAVIHPQSVVHSLVEFVDGSYKAQLGLPDMRLPIQHALTHPERSPAARRTGPPEAWPALSFRPLDEDRFPAYRIVREAALLGGNRGAVVNAADEVAVQAFLAGRIEFDAIPRLLETALERWGDDRPPDLEGIGALDHEAREWLAAAARA